MGSSLSLKDESVVSLKAEFEEKLSVSEENVSRLREVNEKKTEEAHSIAERCNKIQEEYNQLQTQFIDYMSQFQESKALAREETEGLLKKIEDLNQTLANKEMAM